jgi:insertion element IS1 protein InsB
MKCQYCQGSCAKKGCYKRRQLYRCKSCLKYQRSTYLKVKIDFEKIDLLKRLNEEGNSTSSISRLLYISKSSVQRKIFELQKEVRKPVYEERNQKYEIDELKTYCERKSNECWITYAMNRRTKCVIDFVVGRRTKDNLRKVVNTVLELNPKTIYSDHLNIYPTIIPKKVHVPSQYQINTIERKNLDLRKDQKYLNRKTICYAKSEEMIEAKLRLYFWG